MKAVFTTWCTDDYIEATGCQKLINSAKYFYPNIPFYRYNKKPEQIRDKYPHACRETMIPISCMDLINDYDLIIHIDADSTITGTVEELLEADYGVAGVRNNNDFKGCGNGPHFTFGEIPHEGFLNAGLVASTIPDFWVDWNEANKNAGNYSGGENDTLNLLFHSKKYDAKIVDTIDKPYFYGLSSVWGTKKGATLENIWESWKSAYIKENKLFIDSYIPKQIKIIHQAGGTGFYPKQQYSKLFNNEVLNYLEKITL